MRLDSPNIELYTDGGADPNPGKGGYGAILQWKGYKKELSQGFELTTNNRMELLAVIIGLEAIKTKANVSVFSDSKYVVDAIKLGWARKWKQNNWYRTKKDKALNPDLWDRLLTAIDRHNNVAFNWVKGHNGHPENERCDQLATQAIQSNNHLVDTTYISSIEQDNECMQTQQPLFNTQK